MPDLTRLHVTRAAGPTHGRLRGRLRSQLRLLGCAALLISATFLSATGSAHSSTQSVLTVGTTYYIDSLNPFVGIEPQDDTAYTMVFPQLVQYGPGLTLQGDWASSWSASANGLVWTFHLRSGRWSDGVPLTSRDAVWTINTTLVDAKGPTAYLAGVLNDVKSASAPNASTLVITLTKPSATFLSNLEQFFILPQHVWAKYAGKNGAGLKNFNPGQHLPMVSGGPYTITQWQEKGTTVFRPNPYFYGPRSHAGAVALTYYTNATSLLADFEAGNLDYVEDVPYADASKLNGIKGVTVTYQPGNEVTNLGFNSNPLKPRNRELLSTQVREAFEYAIPRQQLVSTVFGGHAVPWANIMSSFSQSSGWVNPAVKPLPYDPAKANTILNALGYRRGPGGIRVVPAAKGRFPQASHQMSYRVIVPDDLDFDGNLQFQILQTAFQKIGVKLTEVPGGDASQAYTMITGPNGKYLNADMYTWYWHPYIDPNFNLSVVTRAQWNNNSDTGMNDPYYDRLWQQQSQLTNVTKRRALVWKMEAYLAQKRPYIQLVNTDLITAHRNSWTGFYPNLWSYGKAYYTSPHPG